MNQMEGKPSYEQLELDYWRSQLMLTQSTMMNCQMNARELENKIREREQQLKAAASAVIDPPPLKE